ncbi:MULTISPECIES: alpha/beta hydrolase family protein [Comamonas]|jgi:predicted alpha/beta hydrolase|uniref:Alpha/beta hydrolase n=1 Tax=Comamonas terrigena TaxID=32013 RepID=A0A2A7UPR1_COMTR|nr:MULTISPECIES: alpha/beta hydrolase [Comamonas]MBD9533472.1 alpha/beta hydrolase [Comamonas sp. CMM01]MDH0049295.1 alpha/beta hydrolase [Comamonas terrigena]MDH0510959.1 alpha/beta hydrolase [Comamonas terrigena]MDH1090561.1 alpha/beta hydrolase [Comamonas terrigena]PEH87234.1 alpha/beta hydrolase [Comamonas terrigena]
MTTLLQPVGWTEAQLAVPGSDARLALRHCQPADMPVRGRVVLAPAVGVPQTFYAAFAEWLAARGLAVTTFDYRGHAASLQGPLRQAKADLLDWAQDCLAVAQHLRALDAAEGLQRPVLWVGHSVGAQLPGLCRPALPVDGMLTVASGSGYWRDNAPPTKRKALLWWWCIQPVITALCGCLPGKRLGLIGDLPAGVVWQWRRWCMHPSYSLGVEGERARQSYAAVRYPVHALSMTDDEMMSWNSTRSLLSWYRNAPQVLERVRPADAGQPRIGHFGFFRRDMADTLWPRAAAVLEQWLGPAGDMEGLPRRPHGGSAVAPASQAALAEPATVVAKHCPPAAPSMAAGQGDLFTEAT